MKLRSNKMWRLWAKSLGEKASKCSKESDKVALIRTIIFFTYLITNVFIISGVIRHWNSPKYIIIPIGVDKLSEQT
jgi:hypothetical protein